MSASGEPRLTDAQRAALYKIGSVRGRPATIEDIRHNVNLRGLAGRGVVKITVELTERGKLVAQSMADARKTRKPR